METFLSIIAVIGIAISFTATSFLLVYLIVKIITGKPKE